METQQEERNDFMTYGSSLKNTAALNPTQPNFSLSIKDIAS